MLLLGFSTTEKGLYVPAFCNSIFFLLHYFDKTNLKISMQTYDNYSFYTRADLTAKLKSYTNALPAVVSAIK